VKTEKIPEKKYHGNEIIPIRTDEYERFIILKNSSNDYLERKIASYPEIKGTIYNIQISQVYNWTILKFDNQISFYTYHNLVTWLSDTDGSEEDKIFPDAVLGISLNKIDVQKCYLFLNDTSNLWGDTSIGFFEDGRQFFIYLPEAFEKDGNLKLSTEKLIDSMSIYQFLLYRFNFDINPLKENKLNYSKLPIN
jgi:hypothetical protein